MLWPRRRWRSPWAPEAQGEAERAMLLKLWRQRPKRARYAADQARRQYQLAESRAVPSSGGDPNSGRHAPPKASRARRCCVRVESRRGIPSNTVQMTLVIRADGFGN